MRDAVDLDERSIRQGCERMVHSLQDALAADHGNTVNRMGEG